MEVTLTFLLSVLASIAAHYICKWLDRHSNTKGKKK